MTELDDFDIQRILDTLPHRYPLLLIDRIIELDAGKRAVGLKNVSANEWFFEGHFPGNPIMPGVLIVEALAQVGAVAAMTGNKHADQLGLFAGIDKLRFRRQVVPGDQMRLEVELTRLRGPVGKATARATVDGEAAAQGELTFALVDKPGSMD